jgi:Mg2+/citrate symporter
MALFISGLFTGMATMIALGIWLNKREKKRGVPKNQNPPATATNGQYDIYVNGELVAVGTPMSFPTDLRTTMSLEEQLQSAIEREDFKEAARIRDLMKKQ